MLVKMGPLSTKHDTNDCTTSNTSENVLVKCTDTLVGTASVTCGQNIPLDNSNSTSSGNCSGGECSNEDTNVETQIYYAVHIPPLPDSPVPAADLNDCTSAVFKDKMEALKLVKKYKRARFKAFNKYSEATQFSINGLCSSISTPSSHNQNCSDCGDSLSPVVDIAPVNFAGEKPSPFKGPKSQDLVRLRKAIENGDVQYVQNTIWENPRYLVSSGDTPAILQEGARYNALHVCAKSNKGVICDLILKTISNVNFIKKLYGDNNENLDTASSTKTYAPEDRCNILLDLYLNTPDKGLNETPLHFAAKYGAVDVVQVLAAYPECDRNMLNKFGQKPKDIICSRVSSSSENACFYDKISNLLGEQYFVPVLRSQDPTIQPTVGHPFSSSKPLDLSGDVISPVMEIQGVAGPMSLDTARLFRKKWKTPPRDLKSGFSPKLKMMLQDADKGLEKLGRDLAEEHNVSWNEYWPFLKTFANFRTDEGRILLEQFLSKRFKQVTESASGISSSDECKPLESSPPASVSINSPITELCDALHSCHLSSGSGGVKQNEKYSNLPGPPPPLHPHVQENHECYNGIVQSDDTNVAISPHLYIEKSCQVFARRIADGITRFPESPGEPIACEVIYLNMLVASCLNDSRFAAVNFARLHCHLAMCVIHKFSLDDRIILLKAAKIILNNRRLEVNDSSSDEELITPYRDCDTTKRRSLKQQKKAVIASVRCIAQHIFNYLTSEKLDDHDSITNQPSNEEESIHWWQLANACNCVWSPKCNRTRKSSSFRRNNNFLTRRRIDFSTTLPERKNVDSEVKDVLKLEKPREVCEESAGEESDTSDTDCGEFFTPPTTPMNQNSAASSEDDLEMESPDEGPEVYIDGDVPSRLDLAVLDAIGDITLEPSIYPNICRWKHLVTVTLQSSAVHERFWQ